MDKVMKKILSFEGNIKEKILSKKVLNNLFIFAIVILAIIIRVLAFNYKSGDYVAFLKPWYDKIIELGRIHSLKYAIGDYNVPYITILTLFTYIPISPLILLKTFSCIFDFILAIYSSKLLYEIIKEKKNADIICKICFAVILFLPTVMIDSSVWSQCDSVYTSFIIISLYYLRKNKILRSFIFLGVAFAFKLQVIFILPIYFILYLKRKDISLLHFLIVPLVNFVMCLPAILMGRSIKECMMIYFSQTGTYTQLTLNYPNLYSIFGEVFKKQSTVLVIFTVAIVGIIIFYIFSKNVKIENNIIRLALLFSILMVYFLPRMHERYGFLAEVLSIIYVCIYRKDYYLPIVLQLASLCGYYGFLNGLDYKFLQFFAIVEFAAIVKFTFSTLKSLCEKGVKMIEY